MNDTLFWSIIASARDRSGGNCQTQAELLRNALQLLSAEEIFAFDAKFVEYSRLARRNDLRAAALIINSSGSDDGFTDFRAWLIGQGQEVYFRALANPDSLADIDLLPGHDATCEDLGYAAMDVYEDITGEDMPPIARPATVITGEKLAYEEIAGILPNLWRKAVRLSHMKNTSKLSLR